MEKKQENFPNMEKRPSFIEEKIQLTKKPRTLLEWFKNSDAGDDKPKKDDSVPVLPPVPYHKLFKYASSLEQVLVWLGAAAAVCTGVAMPLLIILYGEFTQVLIDHELGSNHSSVTATDPRPNIFMPASFPGMQEDNFMLAVTLFGVYCVGIAVVQWVLGYVFIVCLNLSAEKQILRIRQRFLEQVLRQEMAWYDTNQTGDFASRLTEDLSKLRDGIGEKLGMFLFQLTNCIIAVVIAFVYGWKLTLVVLSCMPFLMLSTAFVAKAQASLSERELQAYASAGSVCEEVLTAIRTVVAFGGESKEVDRYAKALDPARRTALRRGVYTGTGNGIMWFFTFATYSMAFWYGVGLILQGREQEDPEYTAANMSIVFFNVLWGAMVLGQATPYLETFSVACGAASSVFALLERQPEIDSLSEKGLRPEKASGHVVFKDVHFNYPSRSSVKILQGVDLEVRPGETVALVGASGSGKSTCLQLLQRFYDPHHGEVLLDGVPVSALHVGWLRGQLGVVAQEPALFAASIRENIALGRPEASLDQIQQAAVQAQAHDFIMALPDGYDTMVGERGAQLSGGQKQRIAIARALVRRPAVLLLDEATSALDTSSEALVQRAIDQACQGRSTIIVAHRLSTVRGADRIVVMEEGRVVEQGTHEQLIARRAKYFQLAARQLAEPQEDNKGEVVTEDKVILTKRRGSSKRGSQDTSNGYTARIAEKTLLATTEAEEREVEEEENGEAPMLEILKLNRPEWLEILLGCVGSVIVGCAMPTFAVLFGDIYGVLSLPEPEDVRDGTQIYSILFLVTGIVTGIGAFLQMYMFNVAGAKLTMRLRERVFAAMLRQEAGWFDDPSHSTGALCARLSGDAASVQGATGTRVGTILQTIATLSLGLGLSLYYSWKLGLVTAAFVPIVLIATWLEKRATRQQTQGSKDALEQASKVATEYIAQLRTVAALCSERAAVSRYSALLEAPHHLALRTAHYRGIAFGLGQAIPFFAYGLSLYYGGYLVYYEDLHYKNIIKVTEALLYGTMMLGQALAFAPDFTLAKIAAYKLMKLMARTPTILDPPNSENYPQDWRSTGDVELDEVQFRYPGRPEHAVLRGLSLAARPGRTVALVGASGCGKSTCLQLLLRFYEPEAGRVLLEGGEVRLLPLERLRAQFGLVSQEPVLFARSLAENIAYGDNSRAVPMPEVIEAARQANIHDFITALPQGYETRLGERGAQLSGGQKQRVAIARALVRRPAVLLLDEATSALDAESEKVVQSALEGARRGRTCVVIAHRLSSVQDAELICVVERGRVVESGSHSQLLAARGAYFNMYQQN